MATSTIKKPPLNTVWTDVSGNIVNNYIVTTSASRVQYRVRNDICFLRLSGITLATVPSADTTILTGLPKPSGGVYLSTRVITNADKNHALTITPTNDNTAGVLRTNPSSDTTGILYECISYPVEN